MDTNTITNMRSSWLSTAALGKLTYAMALCEEEDGKQVAAGAVCTIEREISGRRILYVADLKVAAAQQGQVCAHMCCIKARVRVNALLIGVVVSCALGRA